MTGPRPWCFLRLVIAVQVAVLGVLFPSGQPPSAYDQANHLTSVTAPTTGAVAYAYDAAGERTSLTYPSGHQATYAYTARGQLQSVTDWTTKQTGYTYDNAGRLTSIAIPNGVAGAMSYDNADRLTSIAYSQGSTSLESIGYSRDAVGNPTQMTDSTGTTAYGYDNLDRLTSAAYPNKDAVSYAYDPVGNRTSLTVNGIQATNTYDAADRLTQAGSTSYTYDTTGNELTKTAGGVTTTFGYDPLGRLTGITGPTTATYQYNGDGLRVGKTVNGTTTGYAWDPTGLGTVLGDGTGEYVWGQGLASQVTSSATTYVQSDGLGSVRLLTDATGNVAGRQSFDAYGASRSVSGTALPFGITGEQADAESGLVYLRARYMDPSTGRFLTRDSFGGVAGDPQSQHRYGYAEGDPTANTDPSGRCIGPLLAVCIAWGVADAAPLLTAIGVAVVSSPVMVAMLSEQVQGAQGDINTLLCPDASNANKVGAVMSLGLAAAALLPGADVAGTEARGGVYLLRDTGGTVVRTGRTDDLVRRRAEHARAAGTSTLDFEAAYRTDDHATQRGLEQHLYDRYPNASLNQLRPISARNPNLATYVEAARRFLAQLGG